MPRKVESDDEDSSAEKKKKKKKKKKQTKKSQTTTQPSPKTKTVSGTKRARNGNPKTESVISAWAKRQILSDAEAIEDVELISPKRMQARFEVAEGMDVLFVSEPDEKLLRSFPRWPN